MRMADGKTTYHPLRSILPFINHFYDKDIPSSVKELKKIYKSFSSVINFDDVAEENKRIQPMQVSKGLRFFDHGKGVFDSKNTPITKEQASFRSIKHLIHIIKNNKISLRKFNDKELADEDGITCSLISNIPFINYFSDKDIPNSTKELEKIA